MTVKTVMTVRIVKTVTFLDASIPDEAGAAVEGGKKDGYVVFRV